MRAWFAATGATFLGMAPEQPLGVLAAAQLAVGFAGTPQQFQAWTEQIAVLRAVMQPAWTLALEYGLLRLEKRIDAVILTDRAILVLEFKIGAPTRAGLAEADDYALDLRDFHAGSRAHAIVPILGAGAGGFRPPAQPWLLPTLPTEPLCCGAAGLADCIAWVQASLAPSPVPLDGAAWLAAAYKPVPSIIEAATMLYARNGVGEIAAARADAANLTRTSAAIARQVAAAQAAGDKRVVFVTGIPGAGKTLCGLNAVFGRAEQAAAAFLTGNVPLVTVLRAALARDAVARRECSRAEAERRVAQRLQNVHRFLEDNALAPDRAPPDRLIVFDEAQRAWDAAKAVLGTRNKPSRLTDSEPWHALEIMGRQPGWAVIVALIGAGQEINTGEAGVAEWGRVIATDPRWQAAAAPVLRDHPEPMQRLDAVPAARFLAEPDLDLTVPLRSVRESAGAAWVAAVLVGDAEAARRIAAAAELPYFLTRDLTALRDGLRRSARGRRGCGIVASAGARRLRAEGLGVQVPDVADWFLNRWPDVRSAEALETFATEYDCQGLELDVVGLAWGGDFLRAGGDWQARAFVGDRWQRATKDFHFIRNTYRVLLTRARYETIIWVPEGSPAEAPFHDPTRPAAEYNAIAAFLAACGARPLEALPVPPPAPPAMAALPGF